LADTIPETASELSKSEKLRRELLANISHDLRTPLTMIKAYTELIRDISGDDKQKREANLEIISRESDRLMSLVSDILDISILQSGSEQMKRESFNLSEAILNVIARFSPIIGVEFSAEIEPDQYIYADERRIIQVLYNFMANAVAHNDGSDISIGLTDKGDHVRFVINDNGKGIATDELPLIWDRYYKAQRNVIAGNTNAAIDFSETDDNSASAAPNGSNSDISDGGGNRGTGLGLAIVKEILTAHNARFGVTSELAVGTTFWFEIDK
jgi:signal transduction histidine kinase